MLGEAANTVEQLSSVQSSGGLEIKFQILFLGGFFVYFWGNFFKFSF